MERQLPRCTTLYPVSQFTSDNAQSANTFFTRQASWRTRRSENLCLFWLETQHICWTRPISTNIPWSGKNRLLIAVWSKFNLSTQKLSTGNFAAKTINLKIFKLDFILKATLMFFVCLHQIRVPFAAITQFCFGLRNLINLFTFDVWLVI